ncbi:MAG: ABC transporter ATP-binding protein [Acidobacteria bacterium]|nr:ABC transporter ATP-binding protein [Acidobacteriota bacterium]
MGAPLLTARGITRTYGSFEALAPLDLAIARGERIALTGPNGAGKTTLLTILAGVQAPSGGALEWADGASPKVGWVPQSPALYPRLTTRENLRLFAGLEGATDPAATADALIARADLGDFADRRAGALSTGTMQRLNLAIALAGSPSLLLLDEPTGTLSPDQRVRLWGWMADLVRADDMALLFSTQSMDEAARNADRVLVLAQGRVLHDGPAADLDEAAFMALLESAA